MESSKEVFGNLKLEEKDRFEFNSTFILGIIKEKVKGIGINQELLLIVALNEKNSYFVRRAALEGIKDEKLLSLFIFKIENWRKDEFTLALEILNKIDDQAIIEEIIFSNIWGEAARASRHTRQRILGFEALKKLTLKRLGKIMSFILDEGFIRLYLIEKDYFSGYKKFVRGVILPTFIFSKKHSDLIKSLVIKEDFWKSFTGNF